MHENYLWNHRLQNDVHFVSVSTYEPRYTVFARLASGYRIMFRQLAAWSIAATSSGALVQHRVFWHCTAARWQTKPLGLLNDVTPHYSCGLAHDVIITPLLRQNDVTSKRRRFDVIMTLSLRHVPTYRSLVSMQALNCEWETYQLVILFTRPG